MSLMTFMCCQALESNSAVNRSLRTSMTDRQNLKAIDMARRLVKHHLEDVLPYLRQFVLACIPHAEDPKSFTLARTTISLFKVSNAAASMDFMDVLYGLHACLYGLVHATSYWAMRMIQMIHACSRRRQTCHLFRFCRQILPDTSDAFI